MERKNHMREQTMTKQDEATVGELLPAQTDVPRCFACGLENPSGLKLRFTKENETTVSTQFTAPYDWTGWGNILHGGFHALLLDEITAWVPFGLWNERAFMTKEMTITYLKPAYVEKPLYIVGKLIEDDGKSIVTRGEIRDKDGVILSEAHCTLIRLKSSVIMKKISR